MPLKEKGLKIHGSNLCNRYTCLRVPDRTAVCCLSSLNLEYYDEWKDTNIVRDLIRMLDNVLQYFIDHASDSISRARYSAGEKEALDLERWVSTHSYRNTLLLGNQTKFEK